MADIESRIHNYFKKRVKSHPQITKSGQLIGWNEEFRADLFRRSSKFGILAKDQTLYRGLTGSVVQAEWYNLTTIFAIYDNEILWLDDHTDNTDFGRFIQREHLLNWIPERVADLQTLISETKFSYLGFPRVISSASDVPAIAERYKPHLTADEFSVWENRLNDVSDHIYFPQSKINEKGTSLNFCIWTRVGGKIVELACLINSKGDFAYSGKTLAQGTGNFYVPH